jgi:hypothetical protein
MRARQIWCQDGASAVPGDDLLWISLGNMNDTDIIKQQKQLLLLKQQEARQAVLERERLTGRLFLLSALCDVLRWRRETVCNAILGPADADASSGVSLVHEGEAIEQTLLELERAIAEHSLSRNAATGMDIDTPPAHCAVSSSPAAVCAATPSCVQAGTAAALSAAAATAGAAVTGMPQEHEHQQQIYSSYQRLDRRLHQQIAPPDDPLALFKHLFLQPLYPAGVECMSLQQLLVWYADLVRDLSAVLQLHEQGAALNQEAQLQELAFR